MKDMNSPIDLYRANAIRVLCNITDAGLLGQIERYLKQAVVDKNAVVSSAALVSGVHLLEVVSLVRSIFFQSNSLSFYWLQVNSDIVRRWNNEVQEAMSSKNPVVQFHAISLLHKIRQSDRLAITKLVSQLTRNSVRSPLAHSLIIRYVSKVIFFLFKLLLSLLIKTWPGDKRKQSVRLWRRSEAFFRLLGKLSQE